MGHPPWESAPHLGRDVFTQAFPEGLELPEGIFPHARKGGFCGGLAIVFEAVAAQCVSRLLRSRGGRGAGLCCPCSRRMPAPCPPHPSKEETDSLLLPVPAVSRGSSPLSPVPLLSCTTPMCNHSISACFHGPAWLISQLKGHVGSPCCWLAGQEPPAPSMACAGETGGSLGSAVEQS